MNKTILNNTNEKCKECVIDAIINELDSILDNENELIASLLYTLKSNRMNEEVMSGTRNEIKTSKIVINTVNDIKRRVKLLSEES